MWKQRSRIMWLTEGDRNTRFFHLRASQRRRRNRISKLKKHDGTVTVNEEEMGAMATDFFSDAVHNGGHDRHGPSLEYYTD